MLFRKKGSFDDRRQYVRLGTVFPVEFRLKALDKEEYLTGWLQGFTRNVSKGGICLEINKLSPEAAAIIKDRKAILSLQIELPFTTRKIVSLGRLAWTIPPSHGLDKFLVGLSFEGIAPSDRALIKRYAIFKKFLVPTLVSIIVILGIGFFTGTYINYRLVKGNKALVQQLVTIAQESGIAKQEIKVVSGQRLEMQLKLDALQTRLDALSKEKEGVSQSAEQEKQQTADKFRELNVLIEQLVVEKNDLQQKLISLQDKESTITADLLNMDKLKSTLEKANVDKMYQWLQIHQNPHTGLVMSFEGDKEVEGWAFIYDQSLALQAYVYFSDYEKAKKMLNFFKGEAVKSDGLFLNAYYANDGSPAEHVVNSGPNIWLGIGVLHYTNKTKDNTYLGLAEEIADQIIVLQNEDADGGIRGGPNITWYATEHNLDAYAFFNMLYQMTQKKEYEQARDRVLSWLSKYSYGRQDIPIKRGKGDSTIATDTYAWSIASLGPQKLEEIGMNPERIIEFAEKNCGAEVDFKRPEGYFIKIKGFDFAPARHVARGGVVSSEWTAQMVLSYKIMADYYDKNGLKEKAHAYKMKADEYLYTLSKMIISSPSPTGQGESCLPYATQEFVDTGHGWMTPKGGSTGCISGTAYTMFAYYGYNPLEFNEK